MSADVRVRFAPSPTGDLHVGGARTALFNYLFAKHHNGKFILRIEDTDQNRYNENSVQGIFDSLQWLGLDIDEGPEQGGEYGPYFQSQRTDLYQQYSEQLIQSGHAYRCFCTSERLQSVREAQEKAKSSHVGYDRHCRDLSDEEIKKNLDEGIPYVVRCKIPDNETIVFHDAIRGEKEFDSNTLDDFVLLKSDRFPTYHLANVVDDHLMKISHVLRGDEWMNSAPKHILLYRAFGWNTPEIIHLPLILGESGKKLSKRDGAVSTLAYRELGYLPDSMVNFLSLLGWAPGDDREKMSRQEIIDAFTPDRISANPAVFDTKKLNWYNGQYIAEHPVSDLLDMITLLWAQENVPYNSFEKEYLLKIIDMMKERGKTIIELAQGCRFFFEDPKEFNKNAVKKNFKAGTDRALMVLKEQIESLTELTEESLDNAYNTACDVHGEIALGKLKPLSRVAVSGVAGGPDLYELLAMLGKDTISRRLTFAIAFITEKKSN